MGFRKIFGAHILDGSRPTDRLAAEKETLNEEGAFQNVAVENAAPLGLVNLYLVFTYQNATPMGF